LIGERTVIRVDLPELSQKILVRELYDDDFLIEKNTQNFKNNSPLCWMALFFGE